MVENECKITIGALIRQHREALKLSQEQLCEGICSPVTISRIENECQVPSERLLRALMDRLGIVDTRQWVPQRAYEQRVEELQAETRARMARFTLAAEEDKPALRAEALESLEELERFAEPEDFLTRQQILSERLRLGNGERPYNTEEIVAGTLEALRLTHPTFTIEKVSDFRYTYMEIDLLTQIEAAYARAGDWQKALTLSRALFVYVRDNMPEVSRYAGQKATMAANYARELGIGEQYEEAIAVAEEGRRISIKYRRCEALPLLLAVLANCHAHLKHREESARLYWKAYYLYEEFGEVEGMQSVAKSAKNLLGLQLE